MRNFSYLITAMVFGLVACSGAEGSAADTASDTSKAKTSLETQKPSLFKKGRVDQYITATKDMTDAMSLLYTRMAPELADQIKPAKMPDEAQGVFSCVVEKTKAKGLTKEVDESFKFTRDFVNYIRSTPDLTIMTLEDNPKFLDLQAKATGQDYEEIAEISEACGVLKMNMKIMRETGSMAAVSAYMRKSMAEEE